MNCGGGNKVEGNGGFGAAAEEAARREDVSSQLNQIKSPFNATSPVMGRRSQVRVKKQSGCSHIGFSSVGELR